MKLLILKTVLLFIIVLGLNIIGFNEGILGAILINLCLFGGIILAGLENRHSMLLFALGSYLFATRPLGLLPFWALFILGTYSMWAWNHRGKSNQASEEEV
jgi:hypothetical protein